MSTNETPVSKGKPRPKVRKTAIEKDKITSGTDTKNKQPSGGSSPAPSTPSSQRIHPSDWYTSEIQSMMYGFGDCCRPLLETAQLIEEIVHQQMYSLLLQSIEVSSFRGTKILTFEDILFLMRNDKVKLKRILKYLEVKDAKSSLMRGIGTEEEDGADGTAPAELKAAVLPRTKRIKLCMDFLHSIDDSGDLTSILEDDVLDDVKMTRDLRRDSQTAAMGRAQYLEYAEARQASFSRKYRAAKFRDWLLKDSLLDIKISSLAMELFNYLAYETVAQIVDLALLVRQDAEPDAFKRIQPPTVVNTECPNFQLFSVTSKSPTSVPESLTQSASPPSSPASHTSGSTPAHCTTPPKSKPKKAKKVYPKPGPRFQMKNGLTPANVREAIRRYWKQSGPFQLFSKSHTTNLNTRLLCC